MEEVLEIVRIPLKYSVFLKKYPTEESCRKRLEKMFWGNSYPVCPYCRGYRIYSYANNRDYKCELCKRSLDYP
ncbi:transposase [Dysgonomonas sp.]